MKAGDCKVGMKVKRSTARLTDDSIDATIVSMPDYRGVVTIKLGDGSTEVSHCQWLTKVDAAIDTRVEQASGLDDDICAQLAEINQKLDAILSLLANGVGLLADGSNQRPSAGDVCVICGMAYSVHSEAFGMKPGRISNCAVEIGCPTSDCQMCEGKCVAPHAFARIA